MPLVVQYNYHTQLLSYTTFQFEPTKDTVTVNIIEQAKYTINLPQFMVMQNTSENTVKWKMEILSRYTIWKIHSTHASDSYDRYVNTEYRLLHIVFVHPEKPTGWVLSYVYHPQNLDFRLHSMVRKIDKHLNSYRFSETLRRFIFVCQTIIPLEGGQNQPVNDINKWVLERIVFTDGSSVSVCEN